MSQKRNKPGRPPSTEPGGIIHAVVGESIKQKAEQLAELDGRSLTNWLRHTINELFKASSSRK